VNSTNTNEEIKKNRQFVRPWRFSSENSLTSIDGQMGLLSTSDGATHRGAAVVDARSFHDIPTIHSFVAVAPVSGFRTFLPDERNKIGIEFFVLYYCVGTSTSDKLQPKSQRIMRRRENEVVSRVALEWKT